ncbi:hypothetical protein CONLIGDRAFT_712446 [Coniochaeta ligniaria NRRL 30616]|uniref:Uncharacterized protein n=1 Tax=Coniochaeta ligniaria NRRL 30616 TaxID=1408157 RepID=A0A1J7IX15_9PEZI|nr:hypothetical protein CONLIGDRAFT_712446 [Coniochaeta ligniaria NRRL 30616]
MTLFGAMYAQGIVSLAFLSLTSTSQLEHTHMTLPAFQDDDECVSKSFALRNLTALAPQVVIDESNPDNNAVVFQLFNPITKVSGECAAHGATLAPDKATGNPELWYNCFVESRDPSITVQFQFDSASYQLTVNETWLCEEDEVDGIFQVEFQASGSRNLTFTCNDKGSQHVCLDESDVDIDVAVSAIPL